MEIFTKKEVLEALQKEVSKSTQKEVGRRFGCSQQLISDTLLGIRPIGSCILYNLGFEKVER